MADELVEGPREPARFVRVLEIPAASPWDQWRAARLSATLGSPLPEPEVRIGLRRLGTWASGRPGRFAAAYVRSSEIKDVFRFTERLEGRDVAFAVRTSKSERAWRRQAAQDALLAIVAAGALILSLVTAFSVRGEAGIQLTQRAHALRAELAVEQQQSLRQRNLALIAASDLEGRTPADVLADLAWLAKSRRSDAAIRSVTWSRGAMSLGGDGAPVAGAVQDDTGGAEPDGTGSVWRVTPPAAALAGSASRAVSVVSARPPSADRLGAP